MDPEDLVGLLRRSPALEALREGPLD